MLISKIPKRKVDGHHFMMPLWMVTKMSVDLLYKMWPIKILRMIVEIHLFMRLLQLVIWMLLGMLFIQFLLANYIFYINHPSFPAILIAFTNKKIIYYSKVTQMCRVSVTSLFRRRQPMFAKNGPHKFPILNSEWFINFYPIKLFTKWI